jgi:hypothetical protein
MVRRHDASEGSRKVDPPKRKRTPSDQRRAARRAAASLERVAADRHAAWLALGTDAERQVSAVVHPGRLDASLTDARTAIDTHRRTVDSATAAIERSYDDKRRGAPA